MSSKHTPKTPVFIDCRQLGGSGIGTYIENLIRQYSLLAVDESFELLAKEEQAPLIRSFSRSNVKIYNDPIYSIVEQFRWISKIDPFGLMHIPHYNAPLFYPGQLIVTVHDVCHLAMKQFFPGMLKRIYSGPFLQRVLNKANFIITVSEFSKSEITKYYRIPKEKITVIYNGVSEAFQPIPAEVSKTVLQKHRLPETYLLFVGNVKPHKNITGLITSYKVALDRYPDLPPLVVLGQYTNLRKEFPKLTDLLRNEKLQRNIIFTGVLPGEDLPAIYSRALVFLFPSFYEGFGLSILEAMACGAPVVTSDCSSIPEIVDDAAYLINPNDQEMIIEAILKMATSTELQDTYRQRGFGLVKRYTWRRSAQQHLDIYQQARQNAIKRRRNKRHAPIQKEKLDILFLDQYGDRVGGGQVILMDILKKFRSSGLWNVYISVPNEGKFTEKIQQLGFPYYCIPTWKPSSLERIALADMLRYIFSSIRSTYYLSHKIKEYDIDVVYCNGGRTFLNGAFLSILFSVQIFFHLHLILENRQKRAVTLAGRLPGIKGIIAVSNTLEKAYVEDAIYSKISIVNNWASPTLLHVPRIERAPAPAQPLRIGVVGQISQAKGQWTVLESLVRCSTVLPVQLSIFGDPLTTEPDQWQDLETKIDQLCRDGWKIKNEGFRDDMAAIYDQLDVLIIPSVVPEAFGLTAIEAMIREVVVIANRSGALPEIIQDGVNGLLYNAMVFDELPLLLKHIINGCYDIPAIRQKALETVKSRYHPETQLNELHDIVYQSVAPWSGRFIDRRGLVRCDDDQ
jgi:glycosyltransferase involved in cell wall biosynthesis